MTDFLANLKKHLSFCQVFIGIEIYIFLIALRTEGPTTISEEIDGDWRQGHEIQKVTITQRLYQISADSTQS